MVNFCAVYGCSNRSTREKDRSYFRLPAIITRPNDEKQALNKERRATWLARIRRDDLSSNPSNFVRVCSDHFIEGQEIVETTCENSYIHFKLAVHGQSYPHL